MTKVVAIANQKGGVGKTAVTLGLASAASARGLRTLVIDVDPQANSTSSLGVDGENVEQTIGDVLASNHAGALAGAITATEWANVDVVPSELAVVKVEADNTTGVDFRLKESMTGAVEAYELVLIDCPPLVGRLLSVALTAADSALLVTDGGADGVRGIVNVMESLSVIQRHMNPTLQIAGIVINRYRRTAEQAFRESELRTEYGALVLDGHIPERTALTEAHANARPIHSDHSAGGRLLAEHFDALLNFLMNGAD